MLVKSDDFIRLRIDSLHPRRAYGHAGHGETRRGRLFYEQTMNQICRHMTFYNIALRYRGVTRIELFRYLVFNFYIDELLTADVLLVNLKAIRLQVPDPRRTAASARILINSYGSSRRFRLRIARRAAHEQREEQAGKAQAKKAS